MDSHETAKAFILDLFVLGVEQLERLEQELKMSEEGNSEFLKGQIFGIYQSLSLLQSQSEAFSIHVDKMDKVRLEKYLRGLSS